MCSRHFRAEHASSSHPLHIFIISLMQSLTLREKMAGQVRPDCPDDLYSQRLRTLEVAARLRTHPLHVNGDKARSEQA